MKGGRTKKNRAPRRKKYTLKAKNSENSKGYTPKFDHEHYSSGDGMLTTVWGPPKWHYLHTMSFNYPVNPTKKDKKHYKTYLEMLQYTLPCRYCRENFGNNLKLMPITPDVMKNRDTFSRYVYELHNLVNKMLGKSVYLTYEEVRDRYENFRARCTKKEIQERVIDVKEMKNKKEKGCTQPLYGEKSRCIIKIVPQSEKGETFVMDDKCCRHKRD